MANRDTRFLIKRSNVPGKIPTNGDLLLGELGLNTADAILYTSGTTANTILPIGWDRVARTGDTMTGGLFTPFLSATTVSATTYYNLPATPFTGGTVSGATNFTNGLTANTFSATSINKVDYIDFNTGTTAPTNLSGRVFYDVQSHSLAYYSNIDNVKIEMGQQLYIRGFNNTGSIIPKGTVLSIQSATNGFPNLTPTLIVHSGSSQVVGLAASDIAINSNGLALSQGILSGITVNTFNVGDILYASPFSAGTYLASTATFPFSARTNQVGFVIATGTTTGEIYVSINNEDENLTLTNIERNILEGNVISTGVYEFTGMTTASTTTFNIAPMKGWIVKNTYEYATLPDVINLYYTGGTNISVTNLASADSTYILITSALTVTQQVTFPTPQQRRENIYLGKVNHPNRTSILNINNTVDYDVSPMSALRDLWSPIRLINQGIIPSPNGANLSFNTSAGILWGNGINWHNNQLSPNNVNIAAKVPASFFYRTQTGGTSTSVTVIDPTKYDVGGVITTITPAGSNDATNQRIYMYPTGVINVLYGQTRYATLAEAIANIQSETFIPYPNAESTGILIGVISVRNDIVADGQPLTNTNYAKFTLVSKFGESFGGTGGLSTTTLQQAYDNSTSPEIVTNSTLGALSVKNGTGNADNVTSLFEGQTTTNGVTSIIRADGYISGSTLHTSGFTANSTGISASTVSATTIFTSGFTANTTGLSATTVSATTYYNLPSDTLQQVYTASTAPRITTNNTLGSLRVRGGTGTDTDNNFIIENNVGDVTSYWAANGNLFLQSLTGTTINATGDINGYSLVSTQSINDEGGELRLAKAQTNTTLSGSQITVDIFQNRFRIFESGGSNRGVYIDLTAASAGVGTNLLSGGGGEVNTASNLGSGTGLFAQKVAADLQFKSLTSTGGTVTFSNNSTTVNLEVVPASNFTGGTVTGATNFTNSLSANSISATTYYNLPQATYVTGGTYSEGVTTYTNNTGGTFNVTSTTTYAAGVISGSTGWSSTGTGQINLPNVKVALYDNANNIEPILIYDLASGTTNSGGIPALANNDTNYVVIEYNGGSPRYNVYDSDSVVDDSSVVLFMVVYRADNFIHTLEFGNQGAGLANKLNDRFIMTDRFGYESGLALGLSGSTGVVTLTAGVAWNGPNRQSLNAINSQDEIFFKNFHSGGTWVYTTTGDTINNTYYDNGTDIVVATGGKYLVNWYFRGQEINDHIYEVYSTNQYDSVALAQLSTEPLLPELITSHAILVGRIIVLVGANTGLTESAFVTVFQPTNVTAHNDLNAIQGGSAGQYYHLNANQYNNIALTNVNNNFSVGQTFNAGITANTISATTVTANSSSLVSMNVVTISATTLSGGTIYGDGSNITNIPVPYGIINAISIGNYLT